MDQHSATSLLRTRLSIYDQFPEMIFAVEVVIPPRMRQNRVTPKADPQNGFFIYTNGKLDDP